MKLTDLQIRAPAAKTTTAIAVDVSEDGTFAATLGGELFESDRLDHLRDQLEKFLKAQRLEQPFVRVSDGRRGVMRGFHAGENKVLVTWEDGEKGTVSNYVDVFDPEKIPADVLELLTEAREVLVDKEDAYDKAKAALAEIERSMYEEYENVVGDASDLMNDALSEEVAGWSYVRRRKMEAEGA